MSAHNATYFLPPEVVEEQRAHDEACPDNCRARTKHTIACGGHAVIGRNLMGTAYYHTLCERFCIHCAEQRVATDARAPLLMHKEII